MALLRAEQIVDAIVTKLKGRPTTAQNVRLNPAYDVDEGKLPGIDIFEGADTNLSEDGATNISFIDSDLDINLKLIVKKNNEYGAKLNLIRKEVEIAMMEDITQGLEDFVYTTIWVNKTKPNLEHGDQVIITMEMNYIIRYRRSITDPSA